MFVVERASRHLTSKLATLAGEELAWNTAQNMQNSNNHQIKQRLPSKKLAVYCDISSFIFAREQPYSEKAFVALLEWINISHFRRLP